MEGRVIFLYAVCENNYITTRTQKLGLKELEYCCNSLTLFIKQQNIFFLRVECAKPKKQTLVSRAIIFKITPKIQNYQGNKEDEILTKSSLSSPLEEGGGEKEKKKKKGWNKQKSNIEMIDPKISIILVKYQWTKCTKTIPVTAVV